MSLEVWRTVSFWRTEGPAAELTPAEQTDNRPVSTVSAGNPDDVNENVVAANAQADRPLTRFLARVCNPMVRRHLVAFVGELTGTVCFLFFALAGQQVANNMRPEQWSGPGITSFDLNPLRVLFIAFSFGVSLAVNSWAFFRVTAGMFNPAVTLGLVMSRNMTMVRGVFVFSGQLIGALIAAALVSGLFPGQLLAQTRLSEGTSIVRGIFIEALITAWFVFCVFKIAVEKTKCADYRGDSKISRMCHSILTAFGLGLILFIAELVGINYTGGSFNPARSFATAVFTTFPGHHWIYWVGPFLGSLLAVGFYKMTRKLEKIIRDLDEDEEYEAWLREHNRRSAANSAYDRDRATILHTGMPLDAVKEEADLERGPSSQASNRRPSSSPSKKNSKGANRTNSLRQSKNSRKINKPPPADSGSSQYHTGSDGGGKVSSSHNNVHSKSHARANTPTPQELPPVPDNDSDDNRSIQATPDLLHTRGDTRSAQASRQSGDANINNLDGVDDGEPSRMSIMSKREKFIAGV